MQAYNSRIIFITAETSDNVSLLEHIGNFLAPVFKPLGMNDGRIVSALIAGFTAKEAVVSTIEMLAGAGGLKTLFTSVASYISFLVFVLLYTPCVAAIAAVRRELGSARVATVATIRKELGSVWKTALVVLYQCGVAWITACIVYQIAAAC